MELEFISRQLLPCKARSAIPWAMFSWMLTYGAWGFPCDEDRGPTTLPPVQPDELQALEESIQATYQRVMPCTVAVFHAESGRQYGSGAIIGSDGLVLTHAHSEASPGELVKVVLGDGRKATGKFLGVHRAFDMSLVKLEGGGPWPAVEMGSAEELKAGDICMSLGFPVLYYSDELPPLLRLSRVISVSATQIHSSATLLGGDSGGPLFSLAGRFVGTHLGQFGTELHGSGHARADLYPRISNDLLASKLVAKIDPSEPFDRRHLASLANRVNRSVVSVFCGGKQVALGLITSPDGWIVTKASELLDGPIVCQLTDGRRLVALVEGISSEHDLAVLKIDATELPVPEWSNRSPNVGMIVATIGSEPLPLRVGTVCTPVFHVPRKSAPPVERPLNPDLAAKVKNLMPDLHGRRDGFPNVFAHDASIRRPQPMTIGILMVGRVTLGGPVVDTKGKVVGINIGSLTGHLTFAIPEDVARDIVQQLRRPTPKDQK